MSGWWRCCGGGSRVGCRLSAFGFRLSALGFRLSEGGLAAAFSFADGNLDGYGVWNREMI
jgi:hypothetical protein